MLCASAGRWVGRRPSRSRVTTLACGNSSRWHGGVDAAAHRHRSGARERRCGQRACRGAASGRVRAAQCRRRGTPRRRRRAGCRRAPMCRTASRGSPGRRARAAAIGGPPPSTRGRAVVGLATARVTVQVGARRASPGRARPAAGRRTWQRRRVAAPRARAARPRVRSAHEAPHRTSGRRSSAPTAAAATVPVPRTDWCGGVGHPCLRRCRGGAGAARSRTLARCGSCRRLGVIAPSSCGHGAFMNGP